MAPGKSKQNTECTFCIGFTRTHPFAGYNRTRRCVDYVTSDLGKLVRFLVREYHNPVRNLLSDRILMVDELYEECKHLEDVFSCTDLGYSVSYGTN